jgi:glycosyltransferase involved in cell wall biosynthesis
MMNHPNHSRSPSILFIVSSDYDSLLEKGVASMILERDEGGFFKKVLSVHPHASKTQSLDLDEVHKLIEFGPDYPLPFLKFKFGKAINYALKSVFIIKVLARLIKRERVNLIRATDPFWCGFFAWAASQLTNTPFCISIHTDYDKTYRLSGRKRGTPFIFKMLEKFVLPRAQLILPIREHLVKDMVRKGVDPAKIRVIPHGISIEDFSLREDEDILGRYGIPQGKKVISFVGRLAKDNYVYNIIEMAQGISKMRDDFVVLVVGDGPERDKLNSLVQEYGLSSYLIFTGFQPRRMVISIRLHSMIALCLKGGFSLIEACAAGCPPVSYNIEWHYELAKNGETGFLVNENDLNALTEAVIYLLDHPGKAKEMGEKARQLAMVRHNILHTSEIKKNCYKELLQLRTRYGIVMKD